MKLIVLILVLMIPRYFMAWPAPQTSALTWQFVQINETRGAYVAVWDDSCITVIFQQIDPVGYKYDRIKVIENGGYGTYWRLLGAWGH